MKQSLRSIAALALGVSALATIAGGMYVVGSLSGAFPRPASVSIKETMDGYYVRYNRGRVDGSLSISRNANDDKVRVVTYSSVSSDVPQAAWSDCSPHVKSFKAASGSPILYRSEAPDLAAKVDAYLTDLYKWVGLQPDCTIKR